MSIITIIPAPGVMALFRDAQGKEDRRRVECWAYYRNKRTDEDAVIGMVMMPERPDLVLVTDAGGFVAYGYLIGIPE